MKEHLFKKERKYMNSYWIYEITNFQWENMVGKWGKSWEDCQATILKHHDINLPTLVNPYNPNIHPFLPSKLDGPDTVSMLDLPEEGDWVDEGGDSEIPPRLVSPMLLLHSNPVSIPAEFTSSPCVSEESGTLKAESECAGEISITLQAVLDSIRWLKADTICNYCIKQYEPP